MKNTYPYSAIVALANEMDGSGTLNDVTQARMDRAVEALQAGKAPFIVTSGWAYRTDITLSIAEAMRNYAVKKYPIVPETIIVDSMSRDTVGDAVFTKRNVILPRGWSKILVVTSTYHAARTHEIFTFVYGPDYTIECVGVDTGNVSELAEAERQSLAVFHDTFKGIKPGDDAAILGRLKEKHPFYNGSVHPKI